MRRFIFIFVFLFIICNIYSQQQYTTKSNRAIRSYKEALNYYRLRSFKEAVYLLQEAIETDERFMEAYMVLSEVYYDAGEYEKSIETYNTAFQIAPAFYTKGYLFKGELELKVGRYQDAKKSFKTFISLDSSKIKFIEKAKEGIRRAEYAIDAVNNPVPFDPVNLGPAVNTGTDEYWPSISADGQTLVITRLMKKYMRDRIQMQEDFYESQMTPQGWSPMKRVPPPLNTPDNEGAQSISANGRLMVYTACNRESGIGRCDIYYSRKIGDTWTSPKIMKSPVNTTFKETQPSLSSDGRIIYFASDGSGGKGGLDIWMSSQNEDGTWDEPVNLGDSINTPAEEYSPFIHHDNRTLYFSSEGHMGMGGFDIFYSKRREDGSWGEAQNIGYPINTCKDEFGLIVNAKGDKAYYSTDINPATGKDIYEFKLYKEAQPQEVSYMKGIVFDKETKERLTARFELVDLETEIMINESFSDPETGEFLICIPTNKNYMLNVSKEKYLFYSDNFALKGIFHLEKPFIKNIPLQSIRVGETIILKNIFYEFDSYELKNESIAELNKLISFLITYPEVKVEISGHTDNVGTNEYNKILSENRAKSVVDYLVSENISRERISFKGYGFSRPVADNTTEEGRAQNRRTEMTIIDF